MANENPTTGESWKPLICENMPDVDDRTLRWAAQLGLDALALGGGLIDREGVGYWTLDGCQRLRQRTQEYGLVPGIVMLHNLTLQTILGLPGRDEEIERIRTSIRNAGAAGIPVVEYNFYNHRAVEGYAQMPGRGGALYTYYDHDRIAELKPVPEEEQATAEETWDRLAYFLRAVCPVAEEADVRLALHPNDPPPPSSRGTAQVLVGMQGMTHLVELVPSAANGMTFCQGSFAEWGVDVVEAIHYFGLRDKIHHVHYRNPKSTYPHYVEPFIDEGDTDMFRAMQAYRDVGYSYTLCSDHVPRMTDDIGNGLVGRAFNHGYIRAMIQAVNAVG